MTETSLLPSALRPAWYTPVSGRISSQALVAENVRPPASERSTSRPRRASSRPRGERLHPLAGRARTARPHLPADRRLRVTGTGVIDPATHALYLVDGFGRLHALDLVTGAERAGWPVQLYTDHRKELVWGAMTLVNGSIYVGTGSYCDRPMVGKVFRIELATKRVTQWVSVPLRLGGGGSVWGWGGVTYSPKRGSLFVATGNAFRGGTNVGKRFKESAGYGEHIVELSLDLAVRGAHHPPQMRGLDIGFSGSPIPFRHPVCGDLVAAINKDGFIYVWRATNVTAGTLFRLRLSNPTSHAPLLSQPAYSPRTGSIYVATPGRLVRVDVTRRCRGRVTWGRKVGNGLFNGSPTIAGDIVWLAENANRGTSLLGFDARSGARRYRARIAGATYTAPTVVGDRLYVGTYIGGVQGFALASGLQRPVGAGESPLPEHRSFAGPLDGWASREDGVYATENGGATWRPLYPRSAIRVARVSALTGMISVGDRALGCACRQRRLWTPDGGVSWRPTSEAVGNGFIGSAGTLWWWRGGALFRATHWPPGAGRPERCPRRAAARRDRRCESRSRRRRRPRQPPRRGPRLRPAAEAAVRAAAPQAEGPAPALGRRRGRRALSRRRLARDDGARPRRGGLHPRREEGSIEWRSIDGGAKWTVSRR